MPDLEQKLSYKVKDLLLIKDVTPYKLFFRCAVSHQVAPADFAKGMLLLPIVFRILKGINTASSLNNHYARLYGLKQILSLGKDLMDPRLKPWALNLTCGSNICFNQYNQA